MYTDEYEERGYPIRSFIIKFIIIVIIILLLIWLLPKFIKPKNTNKPVVTKESKVKEEEVYQNNTDSMQKAAFKYYDKDNLPKENGKYKQVTLQELIDEDYIEPLKDQNGKKINTSKSYLKLTKVDENEYILKINIKDSEVENYVLLNVGHFDYCEDYICEKKEETEEEKKAKEEELEDTKVKASEDESNSTNNNQENKQTVVLDETYKYTKTIPAKLSDWSSWSSWKEVKCNTNMNTTCESNNYKCLSEIKTTTKNGVCYESIRTRKVLVSSYTITRYSTANNQELLNDGWIYIGK